MMWARCQELGSFYLAILLLVIANSGTSSAQITDTSDRLSVLDSIDTPADTDVVIQNWRGLATKDDESHSTRLNVETIRTVDPDEARRLLASNISIEEVRSQARAGDRNTVLRGRIRLNNDSYWLKDITLTPSGNRSTLQANIARSGSEDVASNVGHTVVTISVVDGIEIVKGYLAIDDPKYSGTYNLLLNECYGHQEVVHKAVATSASSGSPSPMQGGQSASSGSPSPMQGGQSASSGSPSPMQGGQSARGR